MPFLNHNHALVLTFFILNCLNAQTVIVPKPTTYPPPRVRSIRLSQQYLYPSSMRGEETCFGNSLAEVGKKDQIRVVASRPFSLFLTTEFSDSYYNLQQYYGENLEDITLNTLILSTPSSSDEEHYVQAPFNLRCKYNVHPYFRLKASLSVKFYMDNAQEKMQFNLLMICASEDEISSFSSFYVPGYVIFWMLFNLALQVYHNYPRDGHHFAIFLLFLAASMAITNDILAYCVGGGAILLVVLREKKRQAMHRKTFTLYLFFGFVVAMQALLTFQGGKVHQLWNSFWIALDNFLVTHIAMFMSLRLIKLSRFRHVFWYMMGVSLFALLYSGSNRFFELQFKNPLNLTCIKISVFLPIMMLPVSNYFTTLTPWMHRPFAIAILLASIIPLSSAVVLLAFFTLGVLVFEIRIKKDLAVIRRRC